MRIPRKKLNAILTSEEVYEKTRKQINKQNKDRARNMENRIAKYLRGSRVPMSGAAKQWKGDCIIPFINNPGMYLVECKLTARRTHKGTIGNMLIQVEWFTKLDNEVQAMNAKFGILIIHYHGFAGDYVFIKDTYVQKLLTQYSLEPQYKEDLSKLLMSIDFFPKIKGHIHLLFGITNKEIAENLKQLRMIKGMRLELPVGNYVVLPIEDFRNVVYNL
jgi:hypothetical protein